MTTESRSYAYCRQSSDMQMSLDMQEGLMRELADRHGRTIHRLAKETESAVRVASEDRPEFMKLRQELHEGDWLFVWRIDRIDRNPFRLTKTMEWLMKNGIVICSHMEGVIDMRTIHGRMMVYGQLMVCDMFISYLREATKAGIHWRKENGFAHGAYKVGRKRVVVERAKRGAKCLRTDVWDQKELADVREIYNRCMAGETLAQIAEDFHANRRKTCNGKLWAPPKKTHRKRSRFANVNERRVRRAFNWYRKVVDAGIQPELMDPTSNIFTEKEPVENREANRAAVLAKAKRSVKSLVRPTPGAFSVIAGIGSGDSELSFEPQCPLTPPDPCTGA
jgi:DNA invertase Pin-like site-specific DNA recombinase